MEVLKRDIKQIAHGQFISHALQFNGSGHKKFSVPTQTRVQFFLALQQKTESKGKKGAGVP